MAGSESSSKSIAKAKSRIFYKGPVDDGGVEMWIQPSGLVSAIYKPHPQLKTKTRAWEMQLTLNVSDVTTVFELLRSDEIQGNACPEFPVLPGQVFRLIEVEVQGQPDRWQCQYIEPQGVIQALDQEFLAIYALVKKKVDG